MSDDQRSTPVRFGYDEENRRLAVEWGDGASLPIPFPELRSACPCAICQGEMGRPGRFQIDPVLKPGEDELADIQLVGAYALGLQWGDGHNTGLYTFEQLRRLGERFASEKR